MVRGGSATTLVDIVPCLLIVAAHIAVGEANGGYCHNGTTYCTLGCCGDIDDHHCCYPTGVFIGCGFGAIGTVFLLIAIFRCRTGQVALDGGEAGADNQGHRQPGSRHCCTGQNNCAYVPDVCVFPSTGGDVRVPAPYFVPCGAPPPYESLCIDGLTVASTSSDAQETTRENVLAKDID